MAQKRNKANAHNQYDIDMQGIGDPSDLMPKAESMDLLGDALMLLGEMPYLL